MPQRDDALRLQQWHRERSLFDVFHSLRGKCSTSNVRSLSDLLNLTEKSWSVWTGSWRQLRDIRLLATPSLLLVALICMVLTITALFAIAVNMGQSTVGPHRVPCVPSSLRKDNVTVCNKEAKCEELVGGRMYDTAALEELGVGDQIQDIYVPYGKVLSMYFYVDQAAETYRPPAINFRVKKARLAKPQAVGPETLRTRFEVTLPPGTWDCRHEALYQLKGQLFSEDPSANPCHHFNEMHILGKCNGQSM